MLETYKGMDIEKREKFYKKLSPSEQKDIVAYLDYRKGRGLNSPDKIQTARTTLLLLRATAQKPLKKLDIREITKLSALVKESEYGQHYKNDIIVNLKRFCKWANPTLNLEDIRLIRKPTNKKIINHKDLLEKEDVEKLISHEPKMFWKAFLITQYEGGLRTKETRCLEWDNVEFNIDGDLSRINVFSTKTKKSRTIFVKQATFYLKKLREQQENLGIKGKYIFHSVRDSNIPIARPNISMWMSRLSKKVLGRSCWNYLLRHSRGNELYQLSQQGKISKDIALAFMGHSEKMSKVYTHDNEEEVKQMLKDQIYRIEDLPPEKKAEFEEKIAKIEGILSALVTDGQVTKEENDKEIILSTEKIKYIIQK